MAGRIRLAATGIQDEWLTGNPNFSYFIMNFKRHTKFAVEAIESPFDGERTFGGEMFCKIPDNKGDLIKNILFRINLSGSNFVPSIGSKIIEFADLRIGGQTIERLTGEYIYMYNQIQNTYDDTSASLYYTSGHNGTISRNNFTYNVFLPFYFFRHPSLAIPVCALTKQLVEVRIKLKTNENCTNPISLDGVVNSVNIVTEFFFVSEMEREYMKKNTLEYLITQVQLAKIGMDSGITKKEFMTNFKHPVKEFFFVAINKSDKSHSNIKNVLLSLNDNMIFDEDKLMLQYEQPLRHHTGVINDTYPFGMYNFGLKPETYYPTGQINMSRFKWQYMETELESSSDDHDVHIYAVNYNVLTIDSGLGGLKF